MEKAMAKHSSTLAWKIPWMGEPGRPQSTSLKESDMTEWLHFHAFEKEMSTHPSIAWRIPGKGEPGRLLSMGSDRVGHGWSNLAAAAERLTQQICQKMAFCSVWLFTWSHVWHTTILTVFFHCPQWGGGWGCVWRGPRGSHFVSGAKCPAACWPALGIVPDGKFDWGSTPVKW